MDLFGRNEKEERLEREERLLDMAERIEHEYQLSRKSSDSDYGNLLSVTLPNTEHSFQFERQISKK